jgi:hypothetical protein
VRWLSVAEDLYRWHHHGEKKLRNEAPLARVGLVYSQQPAWFHRESKRQGDRLVGVNKDTVMRLALLAGEHARRMSAQPARVTVGGLTESKASKSLGLRLIEA